jgi:GNAT superfamily N-acetyltransferase
MEPAIEARERVELVELPPGEPRLREALEVMRSLRTGRTADELERLHAEGHGGGFRVMTSFAHGRFLYVDDLATAERWRSQGYGELLEERLREVARVEGCEQIRLDSGVQRRRAHRFYFRRGYSIESFNFGARLAGEGRR